MTNSQVVEKNFSQVPVIDISALVSRISDRSAVATEIGQVCRDCGFFYITGHGVDEDLQQRLEQISREFFAQDLENKMEIHMALGGKAWRGYFPIGGELTSGKPDLKEGIYFGTELKADHPLVKAGTPMHGANLFPSNIPLFRETVLEYMNAMTQLGHHLMEGISDTKKLTNANNYQLFLPASSYSCRHDLVHRLTRSI
ncbi:isopenicillin N synthase family oxygenase [Anabaena catenula]|uniref:Isopenicillin N synthase family oxygenase n=1 Tax=Anabaena catenula FACHB-362 TaxID=2692877 RepID=A0ABR8JA26_9NOST|nr:isopenicillin N synthase family oxygenase [Anabaena catenula]MBD2695222.1 isopenicillin N synthase family oxygenase [Anabaena catenula FACHB-362]